MNPLREKIEYVLAKGYFAFLRICPAPIIYRTCRVMAALFYGLGAGRRRITLSNLELAFPEKTRRERVKIARAAYDHFGQMIAESAMVLAGKIDREQLIRMVDGREMQKLLELEKNTEVGILAITGHLGNFELMSHYTGTQSIRQGHVVARKGTKNRVIYKSRALPQVVRALRKGEHVGLLIDIKSGSKEGVPVTFFGKETYAIKSSAFLQIKLGVPVVPITADRVGRQRETDGRADCRAHATASNGPRKIDSSISRTMALDAQSVADMKNPLNALNPLKSLKTLDVSFGLNERSDLTFNDLNDPCL